VSAPGTPGVVPGLEGAWTFRHRLRRIAAQSRVQPPETVSGSWGALWEAFYGESRYHYPEDGWGRSAGDVLADQVPSDGDYLEPDVDFGPPGRPSSFRKAHG
jgi:hypothetical protein